MLEERLSELNATLKEVIKALANVGVTVNNMPGAPSAPAPAAPAAEPPAKRGPGRPPAAKAETPPKAGPKPPKEPVQEASASEVEAVRTEAPSSTVVSEAPPRKVTIDQVRSLLVRIMETHNKAEGDATGKTGPGGERAKADLERVSGYGRLPLVPADDYPAVYDALLEIAEKLENGSDEDEEGFE